MCLFGRCHPGHAWHRETRFRQLRQQRGNSALASQRMEGLEPDAQVIKDAELWASGEKSLDDAIAEYKARLGLNQPVR